MEKRKLIALGLIIFLAVQSPLLIFLFEFKTLRTIFHSDFNHRADDISAYEQRFASIKADLPAAGVIGYLSDPDQEESQAQYDYYLTQYALAPLIVDDAIDHQFVIGNFPEGMNVNSYPANELILVRDYGQGIILFQAKPR